MSIRSAIYDLMNDADSDVYPTVAAAGESDPYAVYNMSREMVRTQDGVAVYDMALTVTCYAKDYSDLIDFAATIESTLEGATGTYDDKTIMVSTMLTEGPVEHDGDLDKYYIVQTYSIFIDN